MSQLNSLYRKIRNLKCIDAVVCPSPLVLCCRSWTADRKRTVTVVLENRRATTWSSQWFDRFFSFLADDVIEEQSSTVASVSTIRSLWCRWLHHCPSGSLSASSSCTSCPTCLAFTKNKINDLSTRSLGHSWPCRPVAETLPTNQRSNSTVQFRFTGSWTRVRCQHHVRHTRITGLSIIERKFNGYACHVLEDDSLVQT